MLTCRTLLLFRVDRALKFTTTYVKPRPVDCFQGHYSYSNLSCNWKMGGGEVRQDASDRNTKLKASNLVWRPVSTQASISEECVVKDVTVESEDISQTQEVYCKMSSYFSDTQHLMKVTEAVTKVTDSTPSSQILQDSVDGRAAEGESVFSSERHSLRLEIGASVIRLVKGKEGPMQKKIEEELGVKIIIPSSKKEDSIIIEGVSLDSVTRASERIQAIVDEVVKSPNLDYSHFVSFPLAVHTELVDKLVNFQNFILGNRSAPQDENMASDSNEVTSDNGAKDQQFDEIPNVAVELKVGDDNEHVKVDVTSIPLVSYATKASKCSTPPKASMSSPLSDLGIDKSIFIKPNTFHLTVLMLKLWNKDRVNAATEVLKSISSKVMDALDNRPIYIRLKGLDCMRGSLSKARVLYAPVEEIGDDGRLLRACQVIIDAFTEAGLVLEKDAKQKLKLHATVMNARHRKRNTRTRKLDSFGARGIFKQFGSEEWGEYLIREAHLSQRFLFDESGYYHCCASIPFPEKMPVD